MTVRDKEGAELTTLALITTPLLGTPEGAGLRALPQEHEYISHEAKPVAKRPQRKRHQREHRGRRR